ncbi:MAG: T9SS type A sorting domain-containing protein [bacterium]
MRRMLCLVLMVPVIIIAGKLQPVTVLPTEVPAENQLPLAKPTAPSTVTFTVGRVDTIGGTTYDWQFNGPEYRLLVNSPDYGLHAGWMFSADPGTAAPDRNQRYNFFDFVNGAWNWIDPDFMASGVGVYTDRSGFGNLDVDPVTGVAIFTTHQQPTGGNIRPVLGRDMAPGGGIFEYCNGSPNAESYLWPPISVGSNQVVHCALVDDPTRNALFYTRVPTWCNWEAPVGITAPQPDPNFPSQNIVASKNSQKVCITWVQTIESGYFDEPGYYRISNDGGTTWDDVTILDDPPAYSGDTSPSFHISSLFPWFDDQDRLHIVAGVTPYVRDTNWILPAEIWHWCPDNTPQWSKIHRAGCEPENLQGGVGYNASYACRPSIGQDDQGRLYVAWEQFDSANVEPSTNLLRADIFAAASEDGGNTWLPAVKLTEAGTNSCRFPCVADKAARLDGQLYVPVIYEIDQVSGFSLYTQGPVTNNPIIVHWVPAESLGIGVTEKHKTVPTRLELSAQPNPFSSRTVISYALPRSGQVSLVVYDASGRPVKTLADGFRPAGRYAAGLNGNELASGIYFCTLTTDGAALTKKFAVVR